MASPNPCATLQIWVCLTCVISTYSDGAVQIRVCLELVETPSVARNLDGACFECDTPSESLAEPLLRGFQRGRFCEGGNLNNWGPARTDRNI